MKNLKLVFLALVITGSAYAQYDTTTNRSSNTQKQTDRNYNQTDKSSTWGQSDTSMRNHPDGYYFKNGKTVVVRNGKATDLDNDVTLSNGTVITKNGSYTKRGGSSMMFKENEYIDMEGNVTTWDKNKSGTYKSGTGTDKSGSSGTSGTSGSGNKSGSDHDYSGSGNR